jgi:hypothetical protein
VFTYVYSRYALCLLLQTLIVAALDIKTRDVPTVGSINSLLLHNANLHNSFFANFYVLVGGGATVRFAPVVPWAKAGPACLLTPHSTVLLKKLTGLQLV